jgi:disulfide bond formation protein DsbB
MGLRRVYDRREAALLIAFTLSILAIVTAWGFELLGGYVPCKLCLWQRWPYYLGIPAALAGILAIQREGYVGTGRAIAGAVALIFAVSVGLGLYHTGVEWKFWAGPADCGGRLPTSPTSVTDFRASLESARAMRCDDASWRFLGLSFAGWNAAISALITAFAVRATSNRM